MDEQHARRLERTREIEERLGAAASEPGMRRVVQRKPKLADVIDLAEFRARKEARLHG